MLRLTLKNLFARKLRLIATSMAVFLAVSFVVGSIGLGATLNRVFESTFNGVYANSDVVVRGANSALGTDLGSETAPLPASALTTLRTTPGVAVASGATEILAQLVRTDGKAVGGQGPPSIGSNWLGTPVAAFQIAQGRAPQADNELVVDAATAKLAKVAVGQTVRVVTTAVPESFTLVGVAKFGELDSAAGTNRLYFTDATAFRLQNKGDTYAELRAKAVDGVSDTALRDRVVPLLAGSQVLTGDQAAEADAKTLKEGLSFISTIPLIFGLIALAVSAFIINNIFAILFAQRATEMALLRAIGARRQKVLRSVLFEALLVGLISSILGIFGGTAIGFGLMSLLRATVAVFPDQGIVLDARMVLIGLAAGVGITVVAAFFPALRATRVSPLAALREVAVDKSSGSKLRVALGVLILLAASAALGFGLTTDDHALTYIGAGALGVLIAFYVLGPIYAKPLAALLGAPAARLRGVPGQLARQNAMRNPRRSASTAAALLIMVTLVTLIVVFFASLRATTDSIIDRSLTGDYLVRNAQAFGPTASIDPQIARQLAAKPEFSAVVATGVVRARVDNYNTQAASSIDPTSFAALADIETTSGQLTDLAPGTVGAYREVATEQGWRVGQTLNLQLDQGPATPVRLAVIYDNNQLLSGIAFNRATIEQQLGAQQDSVVFVKRAANVTSDAGRVAIESVTNPYPNVVVQSQAEFRDTAKQQINQLLYVVLALLGLAVIIALFGIANTVSLSVFERTREIGLLRAVGMTRRQTKTMIRWESITLGLLGTVVGLVLGTGFGVALVYGLRDQGIDVISIPWLTLIVIGLVAVVAGFLVALLPSRRAARLNVLAAIASN